MADSKSLGDVFDGFVTSSTYTLTGVEAMSSYSVMVRNICGGTDTTQWSNVYHFRTGCQTFAIPYEQKFDQAVNSPECWTRATLPISELIASNGILPITSSSFWYRTTSTDGLQEPHYKANVYSTSKGWIITPNIMLDRRAAVNFDLALTDYSTGNVVDNFINQEDDRFIVVVSTDNGTTWDFENMVIWNDVSVDYPYSLIPHTGQRDSVDLYHYVGQAVKIGSYAESIVSNGDMDLNIGNILLCE